MPIPHRRPGPSTLSAKIRPHSTKLLGLGRPPADTTVRELQDLIHNQAGRRRIHYPKEYKLGVISYWRNMNTQGFIMDKENSL